MGVGNLGTGEGEFGELCSHILTAAVAAFGRGIVVLLVGGNNGKVYKGFWGGLFLIKW